MSKSYAAHTPSWTIPAWSHWDIVDPTGIGIFEHRVSGIVPGGEPSAFEEGDLGSLPMDLTAIGLPTTPGMFVLKVEGNSMNGAGIQDGDFVIVDKRRHKPGDIVVALIENEVTLKRYLVEGSRHFLHAENPRYDDIELPPDAKVQGVVVGSFHKF